MERIRSTKLIFMNLDNLKITLREGANNLSVRFTTPNLIKWLNIIIGRVVKFSAPLIADISAIFDLKNCYNNWFSVFYTNVENRKNYETKYTFCLDIIYIHIKKTLFYFFCSIFLYFLPFFYFFTFIFILLLGDSHYIGILVYEKHMNILPTFKQFNFLPDENKNLKKTYNFDNNFSLCKIIWIL